MSNAFERSVIYQRRLILVIHQFSFLICGFLDSLTASETAKQGGISLTPLAETATPMMALWAFRRSGYHRLALVTSRCD